MTTTNMSTSSQSLLFGDGDSAMPSSSSFFRSLSDLCSQFTRHIAPAYHHERPERSAQMRLYTLHKGQYLLLLIMFVCLFFIALLMGMAGPKLIAEHAERATQLKAAAVLPAGPFSLVTPRLDTYRRQLWLSAQVVTREKGVEAFTKKCTVILKVDGMSDRQTRTTIGGGVHNRSRDVTCDDSGVCQPFIIMHLGVLEYTHYLVNVSFAGLESVDRHFAIDDIIFTVVTYNPEFTRMEVMFRFFYVLASTCVALVFVAQLRRFRVDDWAIEQKWTALLLPALVAFDGPLFPLTITSDSLLPAICDATFQAFFLFLLLLFWLCIFHGLRQTERSLSGFYLPKFVLVGSMCFAAITMAVLQETNELRDPSYSYQLNVAHYKNFQMMFTAGLSVYVVYLLYLAVRAFGELRSINLVDARLKFHACSLLVVLGLTLSIVFSRYGSGVLEDNFVARLYTSYDSEAQFLALYTVLNCYVYVLAYVYAPTNAQTRENHLLRDNPAFSMINESDDDDETGAMLVPAAASETDAKGKNGGVHRPLILGTDEDSD